MHWNSPKGLPTSSGINTCNCVHSGDPELPKPPTLNTSTLELVHLDYQHASPTSGIIMRYSPMPHHSCSRSSRSGHISGIRRYPESPESSDSSPERSLLCLINSSSIYASLITSHLLFQRSHHFSLLSFHMLHASITFPSFPIASSSASRQMS